MVTKAYIQSIDFAGNTCTVRIPLFEHAGLNERVLADATIAIPPGVYNGYQVGDAVVIGFEHDKYDEPIILGKLYLGVNEEAETKGSALVCSDLIVSNSLSIPGTTKINYSKDVLGIKDTTSDINSLTDIVNLAQTDQKASNFASGAIYCSGPYTNLYGYSVGGFGANLETVGSGKTYTITYNGIEELDADIMSLYMRYMTGSSIIPEDIDYTTYKGCFIFNDDLTVWAPQYDGKNLKLIGIQTDSIISELSEIKDTVDGHDERISRVEQTADHIIHEVFDITETIAGQNAKISRIEQTAENITSTVSQISDTIDGQNIKISQLDQRADQITATVRETNRTVDGLSTSVGELSITASTITARVSEIDDSLTNAWSEITQTKDKVSVVVDNSGNINAASIIAAVNDDGTSSIKLNADKINLEGAVTLSSLNSEAKSNIIKDTLIDYAYGEKSDPNHPESGWGPEELPRVDGYYVWQRITVVYLDDDYIPGDPEHTYQHREVKYMCTQGMDGKDGQGIQIEADAAHCTDLGDCYIGDDGHLYVLIELPNTFRDCGELQGPEGKTGRGIVSVIDYYTRTNTTSAPSFDKDNPTAGGWSNSFLTVDKDHQYLWNVELTTYSDDTTSNTIPQIITKYTEDGKGILNIVEKYKRTATTEIPSYSDDDPSWVVADATHPVPVPEGNLRFLWNVEIITYTDSSRFISEPALMGSLGETGPDGQPAFKIDIENNYDFVPCDSEGIPTYSDQDWIEQTAHRVTAYAGDIKLNSFKVSNTAPVAGTTGYTIVYKETACIYVLDSPSNLSLPVDHIEAHIASIDADKSDATVLYSLYAGTTFIASAQFKAAKSVAGKDGEDYFISVFPKQITKVADRSSNTVISPEGDLNVYFYRRIGASPAQRFNGYYKLYIDGSPVEESWGHGRAVNGTFTIPHLKLELPDYSAIKIELWLDSNYSNYGEDETITVHRDGQDGTGTATESTPYYYKHSSQSKTTPPLPKPTVEDHNGWTNTIPIISESDFEQGIKYIWKCYLISKVGGEDLFFTEPIYDDGLSNAISGETNWRAEIGLIKGTITVDNRTYMSDQDPDSLTINAATTGDLCYCTYSGKEGWYRVTVDNNIQQWTSTPLNITTYYQANQPTSAEINDIWYDITDSVWYRYVAKEDGSTGEWIEVNNVDYLTQEYKVTAVTQTADKINWLVANGTSQSDFTLTAEAAALATQKIIFKNDERYIRGNKYIEKAVCADDTSGVAVETLQSISWGSYSYYRRFDKDIVDSNGKTWPTWETPGLTDYDAYKYLLVDPSTLVNGAVVANTTQLYYYPTATSSTFDWLDTVRTVSEITRFVYLPEHDPPQPGDKIYLDSPGTTVYDTVKYYNNGELLNADATTDTVKIGAFTISDDGLKSDNAIISSNGSAYKISVNNGTLLDDLATIKSHQFRTAPETSELYQGVDGISFRNYNNVYGGLQQDVTTVAPGVVFCKSFMTEGSDGDVAMLLSGQKLSIRRGGHGQGTYGEIASIDNAGGTATLKGSWRITIPRSTTTLVFDTDGIREVDARDSVVNGRSITWDTFWSKML